MTKKLLTLALSLLLFQVSFAQNPTAIVTEGWSNNTWVNSSRSLLTYDASWNLVSSVGQNWDAPTSWWKDSGRIIYTNNADGSIYQYLTQNWNAASGSWVDQQRVTRTYTAAGGVLTVLSEIYTNNTWTNISLQENTYDGSGYLVTNLQKTWDASSSTWKSGGQINYTNNADGSVHQYVSQSWNSGTGTWTNQQRCTYTYSGTGKQLTSVYESYGNNVWVNVLRYENTYDGSDYLVNGLSQNWDAPSSTWKSGGQVNYTNNADGSIHRYVSQSWQASAWVNTSRVTYTYTGLGAVAEADAPTVHVYPNPAATELSVSLPSGSMAVLTVIDLQGKTLWTGTATTNSTQVDVSALPAGLYVLGVARNGKTELLRFVKN